jgi:phage terminase large subunit
LNVDGAPKWSGSVEDGISWIKTLDEIVIHESLPDVWANELTRYQWKVDKRTGEIQPIPAEGNDHIADAIRYALSSFIKKKVTMFDVM